MQIEITKSTAVTDGYLVRVFNSRDPIGYTYLVTRDELTQIALQLAQAVELISTSS